MINAVIIDDEDISLKALCGKINAHCPEINVQKLFLRPEDALEEIEELQPDVVFLDIEMPKMNGFTFLKNCHSINFQVIFTTAYSEYAIHALRISALDFLLKPIDVKELMGAIERLKGKLANQVAVKDMVEKQIQLYQQQLNQWQQTGKIALPCLNGLEFVDTDEIIKVHGENVYSVFFLKSGKKITASLTLKETDQLLNPLGFFRVHKSFIINLKYISRYIKGEGGVVILTDGSEVEVSRRNKAEFLKKFGK